MLIRVRALVLRASEWLHRTSGSPRGRLGLLAAFGIIAAFIWVQEARDAWGGNDFIAFYSGAEAVLAGEDIFRFVAAKQVRRYIYPPTLAVLICPLAALPYKVAAVIWIGMMLGALVYCVRACHTLLRSESGPEKWFIAILVLVCAWRPLDSEFGNGQVNLLVLACICKGAVEYVKGRSWVCGVFFALATCIKVTPGLLLLFLLLKREWRTVAVAAGAMVIFLVVLPAIAMRDPGAGIRSTKRFAIRVASPALARKDDPKKRDGIGRVRTPEQRAFVAGHSLRALSFRFLSRTPVNFRKMRSPPPYVYANVVDLGRRNAQLIFYGLAGVVLVVTVVATGTRPVRGRPPRWTLELAVWLAAILLISPVSRKAHFVAMMVPFACGAVMAVRMARPRALGWLLVCLAAYVASSSSVSGKYGSTLLGSCGLYTLTAALPWGALAWVAWKGRGLPAPEDAEQTVAAPAVGAG